MLRGVGFWVAGVVGCVCVGVCVWLVSCFVVGVCACWVCLADVVVWVLGVLLWVVWCPCGWAVLLLRVVWVFRLVWVCGCLCRGGVSVLVSGFGASVSSPAVSGSSFVGSFASGCGGAVVSGFVFAVSPGSGCVVLVFSLVGSVPFLSSLCGGVVVCVVCCACVWWWLVWFGVVLVGVWGWCWCGCG